MALTPDTNDAFLREVDDAVRQDELRRLWEKYGRIVVAAVVAALLAYGGYLFWRHYDAKQSGVISEVASQLVDDAAAGKPLDPAKIAELKDSGRAGYEVAADMLLANEAVKKGNVAKATEIYGALAKSDDVAQPFRDAALIRQTMLQFDQLPADQVVARLKPLAVEGGPWFGSAGELVGLAYMKMGKRDLAAATFSAISKDPNVPPGLSARALQMASVLGADVSEISMKQLSGEDEGK